MRDNTATSSMGRSTHNPFIDDIFSESVPSSSGVATIHQKALSLIESVGQQYAQRSEADQQSAMQGRTFLLTAPRAGYGKSHLLGRLREQLKPVVSSLVLPFDPAQAVTWPVVLHATLRQFSNQAAVRNRWNSLLEEHGQFLLSRLILSHLEAGSLKEREVPEDEVTLRTRFAEVLRVDANSKLLGWSEKKNGELGREAPSSFLAETGLTAKELGFWLRLFLDLNKGDEKALDPLRGLSNGEARERFLQLLRISVLYRPVLAIADGIDGFFSSETAGLAIAGILSEIREHVPRSIGVLSVNQDLWDSIFDQRLPSAFVDRLSGDTTPLYSISPESAAELIRNRLLAVSLPESANERFIERLSTDGLWIDLETNLTPRSVLREARALWDEERAQFFDRPAESDPVDDMSDVPLVSLTDKADFFSSLQEEATKSARTEIPEQEADLSNSSRELEEPEEADSSARVEVNPFFVPSEEDSGSTSGIDSIINDIRGSGSTVVSEAGKTAPPPESTSNQSLPTEAFQAGPLSVRPSQGKGETGPRVWPGFSETSEAVSEPQPPLSRPQVDQMLRERERALVEQGGLVLDLPRIERFLRIVGAQHGGLGQTEERYPSSRTVCLRWQVRSQSVLVGFESPENIYFWNNLLQQSLASSGLEKISAFSHPSEAFDPGLFAGFGFSPAVIRGRIDIIEMNDRELSIIYGADEMLQEHEHSINREVVLQAVTLHLDPLWRRISQAL